MVLFRFFLFVMSLLCVCFVLVLLVLAFVAFMCPAHHPPVLFFPCDMLFKVGRTITVGD